MSFINRKRGGLVDTDHHRFPGHSAHHALELSGVRHRDSGGSLTLNFDSPATNLAAGASTQQNAQSGFGMTGDLPNGLEHSNQALQYPGEGIGAAIGSIWGAPGLGMMAGKNAGLTIGDAVGGNTKALGWDMSSNLPPGMQATGMGGVANTVTGLPLHQWFGIKRGGPVRRDDGGAIGGMMPSAQSASPTSEDISTSYAKMTPEQLQETLTRVGPASQQGQIAARVLQQKKLMPNSTASTPDVTGDNSSASATGQIPHMAGGGVPAQAFQQMFANAGHPANYGLLNSPSGAAGGRTDTLPHAVAADSYVIPADVVSGLGEGDTMSGAKVLDAMLHSMPYGIDKPPGAGSRSHPPPGPPRAYQAQAKGGKSHGAVPVIVANGEFIVRPDAVQALGGGNMKRGHRVLDAFVLHVRKKTADTLHKLPPPVK